MNRKQPGRPASKPPVVTREPPATDAKKETDAKEEPAVKKAKSAPVVRRNSRATTSTAKPAADKQKPAADKQKPAADKQKPVADKQKPASDKQKPAANKQKPAANKQKAAADKQKPAGQKQKPAAEKQKHAPPTTKKGLRHKKSDEPDPQQYADLVAKLPDYRDKELADESERDEPIWINPPKFFDNPENVEKLHKYVTQTRLDTGICIDRALYNLLKKNYDIPAATETVNGLVTTRPIPWSKADCEIFRRCFASYGKNFMKIQEIMDHKTKREVVAHYYNTKQEEQYKSTANIGPDEVDFGDSDDDGDVTNGNCQLCTKERSLLNCNGDLICKSCRLFKDEMEDFDEEVQWFDFLDGEVPRARKCPRGWEAMIEEGIEQRLHEPISSERFEELKEKELERVKNLVNTYGEGETLEEVLRDKPRKYGFFFLNQDHPPTKCQTEVRLLKNETGDRILRCKKMEEELEKEYDELVPLMERVEIARAAYNKKMKAEPKPPRVRITAQWSEQDINFACGALLSYGMDFNAVSAVVRTKSVDMCKDFYEKYKKQLSGPVQKREDYLNEGLVEPKEKTKPEPL